jgi:CheY-like chemotaxis protein
MPGNRLAGCRVLLVEDDIFLSMLVEDMLDEFGCRVVVASSVSRALALLDLEHGLDAAILDVSLFGGTSYDVADVLAARAIPFTFVTGYAAEDLLPPYRHHPVLTKPYSADTLAKMVARLVGR